MLRVNAAHGPWHEHRTVVIPAQRESGTGPGRLRCGVTRYGSGTDDLTLQRSFALDPSVHVLRLARTLPAFLLTQ